MKFIFSSLVILYFCGCSQNQKQSSRQNIVFTVDSSLIDSSIQDSVLGISFSPPKNWDVISSSIADSLYQLSIMMIKDSIDSNLYNLAKNTRVLYNFRKSNNNILVKQSLLIDSTFAFFKIPIEQTASFTSNNFIIHQALIKTSSHSGFMMIFTHPTLKKPVQFDFIFSTEDYPKYITTIESVAGSVTLLSNNATHH